jgi:glucose-6-phosphate dehydrogenase assembly protein OpcA
MSAPSVLAPLEQQTPVPFQDIELELNRRLKEAIGTGTEAISRARMSNLVIYCDTANLASAVAAEVPQIVAIHPARVFLLVAEPSLSSGDETAYVSILERPGSDDRKVFSEVVTLCATGRGVERLPFAVRGLLIGNLPTNLWWAAHQPPPFTGPLLHDLAEYAEQILYDSIGWTQPARGVAATASWFASLERVQKPTRYRIASDLNWRRLKYWRRVLAQALDPATADGAIASITEVLIEHGPHAVIQAWLLGSWLASCLQWRVQAGTITPNVEFSWHGRSAQGPVRIRIDRLPEGPSEVRRVRIVCKLGGVPAAFDIRVEDERRLAIHLEGFEATHRTVTITPQSTAELVGRQLSDRERDPIFCESMSVAGTLSQSLLG